jgi:hypothetical protein
VSEPQRALEPLPPGSPEQWAALGRGWWDGQRWLNAPGGAPLVSEAQPAETLPTNVPGPPPTISPDGRFYSEAGQWHPMPAVQSTVSESHEEELEAPMRANRVGPAILLAGAVLSVIGCFLPWLRATAPLVGTVTKSGLSGDGLVVLAIAGVAALLGIAMLATGKTGWVPALVGVALASLTLVIVAIDYSDISGRVAKLTSGPVPFAAEVGEGLYLVGFGAIVWAVGSFVSFVRPQS